MFELLSRYFWILGLLSGVINYYFLKKNIQTHIEEDPSREPGYNQFLTYFLGYNFFLWLLIGAILMSQPQETIFTLLWEPTSNWVHQLFWALFITSWCVLSWWIIMGQGAEFLESHPGLIRINVPGVDSQRPSAKAIRMVWIGAVVVSLLVFSLFFTQKNMPTHHKELPEHHIR